MNVGRMRHTVTLTDIPDATPVTYSPTTMKCSIEPLSPGSADDLRVTHRVEMWFNPQVSFQTKLVFTDKDGGVHDLLVKGIQNVEMLNRELVLLCEEVMTPP